MMTTNDNPRTWGRLHNLTGAQETSLQDFKVLLAEKELFFPEAIVDEKHTLPPSHDDAYLLRFLRAGKFNIQQAARQFEATEKWRNGNCIAELYDGFDVEEFEETRKYYPQWTGRRDKNGVPIQVYQVGALDTNKMNQYYKSAGSRSTSIKSSSGKECKLPVATQRLVVIAEHGSRFVNRLCTAAPSRTTLEIPIETTVNIVDITGLGFTQFWSLRNHLREASTMAQNYYPEALEKVFVIGAPPGTAKIWAWAKGWFDANTTSKIFFVEHGDEARVLGEHIDLENVPRRYGGTMEWSFGDVPDLDEELKQMMKGPGGCEITPFPKGTLDWVEGESKKVKVLGKDKGERRL